MLNAFRHHGSYRSDADHSTRRMRCSTPFGITDHIGCTLMPAGWRRAPGAQRLSASRIISDRTPAGGRWSARSVLNAFRHHGSYRRGSTTTTRTSSSSSAQRLSASRIISVDAKMQRYEVMEGAQRLSASRIISGAAPAARRGCYRDVLNAFRHHGSYRARRSCTPPRTATSAQRLSASRIISATSCGCRSTTASAQRLSASRIISAGGRCGGRGSRLVLNAFRHHGSYRAPNYLRNRFRRVLNAFRHHGSYRAVGDRDCRRAQDVLNAFRHHGSYRIASCASASTWPCAQRLSASRIISVPSAHFWPQPGSLCSTPFGITDHIGRLVAALALSRRR